MSLVRPGEVMPPVSLLRHREPALLEGRHDISPLPDLLGLSTRSTALTSRYTRVTTALACLFPRSATSLAS